MKARHLSVLAMTILLSNIALSDDYLLTISLEHFTDPNSTSIDVDRMVSHPDEAFQRLKSTRRVFRQMIQVSPGRPIAHTIEMGDITIDTTGHIGQITKDHCPVTLTVRYQEVLKRVNGLPINSTLDTYGRVSCKLGHRLLLSGAQNLGVNELRGLTLKLEPVERESQAR